MKAIIDIGSNSVRLMLWADGKSLLKRLKTTRLGEGLSLSGKLSPQAMERTAYAVAEFSAEGHARGAEVYAFATAAVRSAQNGGIFCKKVKLLCGVDVDVVSGKDEALLAVFGAVEGDSDGGVLDVGGASTEICIREAGEIAFSESLNIGAVRLYDLCGDDPALLCPCIAKHTASLNRAAFCGKMYAVGGTASALACLKLCLSEYDGKRIQDLEMTFFEIDQIAQKLLSLTVEERKRLPGMDQSRADILGGGALLIKEIMKKMSLERIYASDRDNLEGYLKWRNLE